MHGRAAFTFAPEEIVLLRRHLEAGRRHALRRRRLRQPGLRRRLPQVRRRAAPRQPVGADPARRRDLHPQGRLRPRQRAVQQGRRRRPRLPAARRVSSCNGHWAVIYSKYDIGCALERHQGLDCKGYSHESALESPPTSSSTHGSRSVDRSGVETSEVLRNVGWEGYRANVERRFPSCGGSVVDSAQDQAFGCEPSVPRCVFVSEDRHCVLDNVRRWR